MSWFRILSEELSKDDGGCVEDLLLEEILDQGA